MEKGYIENGFIVDLSHTKKVSEIIYELSRVLDMPESKGKHICLKLGIVDLTDNELKSIKALVELMESDLAYISTSSAKTLESATALEIKVSEFSEQIDAPTFDAQPSPEVSDALDNIFGEGNIAQENSQPAEQRNDDTIDEIKLESEQIVEQEQAVEEDDEEIKNLKVAAENLPTVYIRKTIRSGQSISSDGNILIIGDVNPGAEIIAKGDITVWGILGGIAFAGSDGNNYAKIRALKLNPVQIRIGEVFARRPDTVNLPYVQKTSQYIPEEAYTQNGSIIIRKIHEEN